MTITNFYKAFLILSAFSLALPGMGQEKTSVKASVDRTSILIGEPIQLTLEADIPENSPIRFFRLDSITHFEVLSADKIDTANTGQGTVLRQVVYLTSFDSGKWVIPPLLLVDSIRTDSFTIDVSFSPFDPKQPYHDVKDIIEVDPAEKKKKQTWWWYAAGGAILLALLLYFLLRKKKKPVVQVIEVPVDPYKEAMDLLDKWKSPGTDAKLYYSSVVDIFRVYVAKKKGIHSFQTTSEDLIVQIRQLLLPAKQFDQLSQSLRLSDLVKFAKYTPSAEDDQKLLQDIKQAIQSIEELN